MPHNRYISQLVTNLTAEQSCLRSLKFAIQRYLNVRRGWLSNSSDGKNYSWRGGWTTGRLFFNRNTTAKNIKIMEEALEIIDNRYYAFNAKIHRLEGLWLELSSGGRGRELLSAFFSMVNSQELVLIPKKYHKKGPLLIVNNKKFTQEKRLGRGGGGVASQFTSENNEKMVVKKIYNRRPSTLEGLDNEASFFQFVYETLGPDFIPDYQTLPSNPSTFFDMKLAGGGQFMAQPLIHGTTLRKYALACKDNNVTYPETEIFASCFTFLYRLHELGIAHCDAHCENIMILDDLGSIFIIDYGVAMEREHLPAGARAWNQYVMYDLAYLFYSIWYVRSLRAKRLTKVDKIDMEAAVKDFDFERWVRLGLYKDLKSMVRALVNYSNKFPWWNPPKMKKQVKAAQMFDMTSPEKAKYCDDASVTRFLSR